MNHNNSKTTVIQDFNGLSITIPTSIPKLVLILSTLILSFILYIGLYEDAKNYFSTIDYSDYFQIIIALGLVFIIVNFIRIWLWLLFGKEIIEITNQHLKMKNSILGLSISKIIPISEITQVSVNSNPNKQQPGKILLHRGTKVIDLGNFIRAEESVYLVQLMNNKLDKIKAS